MKKLMIAACAVAFAAVAQAATYTWGSLSPVYTHDSADPDWPTVAEGTTAYLVFVDAYEQSTLVSDFAAGTVDFAALSNAGSGTINADGTIDDGAFASELSADTSVYFVCFQDDTHMFISGDVTAAYDALVGSETYFDYDQVEGVWTGVNFAAADGYAGAGWYQAAPEPTSGLLMLLGMAGLALRRRRA